MDAIGSKREIKMGKCWGYEQEIRPKDLLIYVLKKWRSIMLTAIAGCVLAGIYAVCSSLATAPDGTGNIWKQLWSEGNINLIKWAAIGFAIGIFVCMFCCAMEYACGDRIREERELKERYGYHLLGVFRHGGKNRFLSCIDLQLEKWKGYSKYVTENETYRIIAANVTNLAGSGGVFLVTGTVDIERLQEFSSMILSQLHENIMLITGADMNENADTLEALAECDAVILVEEIDKSSRVRIQKELDSIDALNKTVVGYVLL